MHAFTRLASFLVFVLSLNFLVYARPASISSDSNGLSAPHGSSYEALSTLLVDLGATVGACVEVLGKFTTSFEVSSNVT
jgi:hypothetical protein